MTPKRIQLSRKKGWKMPPNTIKVDRSTKFGNPFYVAKEPDPKRGTYFHCWDAEEAVRAFREHIEDGFKFLDFRAEDLEDLRGKDLACWCKPENPCHAYALIEIANTPKP